MTKIIYSFLFIFLIACTTKTPEPDPEPTPDTIPEEQDIVYSDTSGLTGELTVYVKYYDIENKLYDAPEGTSVSLYATLDDLINGLSLYNVTTTENIAYFGYINYGNYYINAATTVDTTYYYGEAALQIRPDRQEGITLTLF